MPDPFAFDDETAAEERRQIAAQLVRWSLAFALLFAAVFLCFWWSGAAIRFSADRVAHRAQRTWKIWGTVRNAVTHDPVPWAVVQDDPSGLPPFFQTDANFDGAYSLQTLPEPHHLLVRANGFQDARIRIGRQWFTWLPDGEEHREILLNPE